MANFIINALIWIVPLLFLQGNCNSAEAPQIATSNLKILIIGDSLTEGYGVKKSQAFPALLEQLFIQDGLQVQVINGGISGSTTASGISRLKWFNKSPAQYQYLILALGANDGLRGLSLEQTQHNLEQTITSAQQMHIEVVLAGMQMPPNYGQDFQSKYQQIFRQLCQKWQLTCIDFLLQDVAGVPKLNIEDGIHPNAEGHKIIAKNLYPLLKKKLFPSASGSKQNNSMPRSEKWRSQDDLSSSPGKKNLSARASIN